MTSTLNEHKTTKKQRRDKNNALAYRLATSVTEPTPTKGTEA
jgi:hypothetical protein